MLLPPLEHLWVVCDSADSLVRERMRDLLNRRRQFEALSDYVRLHPHVNPAIFQVQEDPVSSNRPGWIMGGVVKVGLIVEVLSRPKADFQLSFNFCRPKIVRPCLHTSSSGSKQLTASSLPDLQVKSTSDGSAPTLTGRRSMPLPAQSSRSG